jgi:hypothetical protein
MRVYYPNTVAAQTLGRARNALITLLGLARAWNNQRLGATAK